MMSKMMSKIKIEQKKASKRNTRKPCFYWQRGWDSNPRWLITTLDFEFVILLFRT